MTVKQLAWNYLDAAQIEAARTGRNALTLALKKCHGQQEIDEVLRCNAEDTALPVGDSYVLAWDDDLEINSDRQTLTSMVLSGIAMVAGVAGGKVIVEPSVGHERSAAMAL